MSSKKAEARERVKAMREAQARQERKKERLMRFGIAGAVIAAVVIIAVAVVASRGGDDVAAIPTGVNADETGLVVGEADAPVTVDLWVDFLCPHCKDFEDANAAAIDELKDSGQAQVVYHPLTFTGGQYSSRANNAFACASDEGKAAEFVAAAFANPQQWTDNSLADLGDSAGIGGDYESCVRADTYSDWSTDVTESARDANVTGTPTVFVNGELLDSTQWTPEGITAAVTAAAGGAATDAPSGSPAATATE
ncbi:MAG TPA: thioredoxin domain-containing protein [Jiangellaceae bacterium]